MADDDTPRLSRKHTITPHEYGRADKSPRLDAPALHTPEGEEHDDEENLVRSPSRLSGLLGASVASRTGTQRSGLFGRLTAPLQRRSSKNLLQRSSSRDLLLSSPSRSTSAQLLDQHRPSATSAAGSAAPVLGLPTPQSATVQASTTSAPSFVPGLEDPTPQSATARLSTPSALSSAPILGDPSHQQEVESLQRRIKELEHNVSEANDARDAYKTMVGQSRLHTMDVQRLLTSSETQATMFKDRLNRTEEQLDECREQLKHESSTHNERLQRELAQLQDAHKLELAHVRELAQLRDAHKLELAQVRETHQLELTQTREAHRLELVQTREAHRLELSRYDKLLEKALKTSKHSPPDLRRRSRSVSPSWGPGSDPPGGSQESISLPPVATTGARALQKNFSDLSMFDDNLRSQAPGQLSSSPPAIKRALWTHRQNTIRKEKLEDLLAQNAAAMMGLPGEDSQDRINAFLSGMAVSALTVHRNISNAPAVRRLSEQMHALYEVCALACLKADINNDLLTYRPVIAGRQIPSLRSILSIWPNVDAENMQDQRELNSWADDEMMLYQLEEIQAQHCGAHQHIISPAIISQLLSARYAKMDDSGNAQKDANGRDILMGEVETQEAIIAENSQRHFLEDPDKGRYLGLDMSADTTQVYFACLIAPGHWIPVWFEMATNLELKMSACDSLYSRKNDDAYGARIRFLATVLTQHPRSPFHGYTPVSRVRWVSCSRQHGGRDCGYLALHNIRSQIETRHVMQPEHHSILFSAVPARQECLNVLLKHVGQDTVTVVISPDDRLLSSAHNILQLLTDYLYPRKHGVKLIDLARRCYEVFSTAVPDAQAMQSIISGILTALPDQFTKNPEQRHEGTDAYLADPSGHTVWQPQPGHGRHFTTSTLKRLHVTSELQIPFDADDDLNHDFSLVISWYRSSSGQQTEMHVDTSLQQPSQLMRAHHSRFSRHPELPVELKNARDLDQNNIRQRYWIEQRMINVSSTLPLFQTRNTKGLMQVLDSVNVIAANIGRKLEVCMLAMGWDGLTTNAVNMELFVERWPSLSFRLTLLINGDRVINSAYGRYDPALNAHWYHFDVEYLARLLKLDRRLHICPRPQLEQHLTNVLQKSSEELMLTESWSLDVAVRLLDLWTPSDGAPCELCMADGLLSPQGTQLTFDGKISLLSIYHYYKHLILLAYLTTINCGKILHSVLHAEQRGFITPLNGLFRHLSGVGGRTNAGLAVIRRECCICHARGTVLRRCGADASNLRCDPECPVRVIDAEFQSTAAALDQGPGQVPALKSKSKTKEAAAQEVVGPGPPAQHSVWPVNDCPMCEEKALPIGAFILHIREHIGENGGECPRCHKKPAAKDVFVHLCTCYDVQPWYCCQCEEVFYTARRLSEHFAGWHIAPESKEGPFACTIEECAGCQGGARVFQTADAWSKHCAFAHSHYYGLYYDLSLESVCTRVQCRKRLHDSLALQAHNIVHKTAEKKAKKSKKASKE